MSGSHAVLSATLTSNDVRRSSRSHAMSLSSSFCPLRLSCSTSRLVSAESAALLNATRATLWGLRPSHAFCIARRISSGSISSRSPLTSTTWVVSGTTWRERTARPMSFAISSEPLSTATSGRSSERGVDAREQLADAREHDPGLAERRQHRLDVLQERPGWPDDEHTARRQRLAVRVEQIRRAVERDGCLARAGAALHDERAAEFGADDGILLGLDRRDDVAHAPGALGGERRHERGLALQARDVAIQQLGVEDLVVDAHDVAAVARAGDACARAPSGVAAVAW